MNDSRRQMTSPLALLRELVCAVGLLAFLVAGSLHAPVVAPGSKTEAALVLASSTPTVGCVAPGSTAPDHHDSRPCDACRLAGSTLLPSAPDLGVLCGVDAEIVHPAPSYAGMVRLPFDRHAPPTGPPTFLV
ncbi:MAG TPA: hypothetical protein VIL84_12050 [Devosiaceae bacterium]